MKYLFLAIALFFPVSAFASYPYSAANVVLYSVAIQHAQRENARNDREIVETALNAIGLSYARAIANTPTGMIGVVVRASGEIRYIQPNYFNKRAYVRL